MYDPMTPSARIQPRIMAPRRREDAVMSRRHLLALGIVVVAIVGCAAKGPYRPEKMATERFVVDPATCPELQDPSQFHIPPDLVVNRSSHRVRATHPLVFRGFPVESP